MKEYKIADGEHLDDRVPHLAQTVTEYFGPISGTIDWNGHELFVVNDPDNPVLERVLIGPGRYSERNDTLFVEFEGRPTHEIVTDGLVNEARKAVDLKNRFLLKTTGRDTAARRKSLKQAVDADAPELNLEFDFI